MNSNFSNKLKTRFLKDYNLPIQVVHEPMFSYYIDELNNYFNTKKKLSDLTQAVISLGGEDQFFAESDRIKNKIISAIKSKNVYKKLQNDNLSSFNVNKKIKQENIYNMNNVNKTFISIDLKHANFNVLKMYDPELVLGFNNYEEMIGSETNLDYFKKSKYLRQVIFGNLLPKKQRKLQEWVMSQIIDVLNENVGIKREDLILSSPDEVIFVVGGDNIDKFIDMIKRRIQENDKTKSFFDWIKVDAFTLKSIGNKKFFVKEKINGEVEFKAIPSYFFMQAFKKYLGKKITEMDRMFYHDGMIATFNNSVFDDK